MCHLESLFKTLESAVGDDTNPCPFDISDEEFADDIMKEVTNTVANETTSIQSGDTPIQQAQTANIDQGGVVESFTPRIDDGPVPTVAAPPDAPTPSTEVNHLIQMAKIKIDTAIKTAGTMVNPTSSIQQTLDELTEEATMATTLDQSQQQQYQIQSLQYLCNALIKNAKLAEKMTRVVNTNQVTKAVNKALLMEDMNPVHLSLTQFLQHPLATAVWTVALTHDSDFNADSNAWGRWWMSIVEAQVPRQRLRRTLHHLSQFNALAIATFSDFGHNPTRFTTEWLVIQLTRLGDHLLAANLKSECGFNWPYAYQKVAAYLARNKVTAVREIFAKIDALWPAGVRMNFHYGNPAFNDCVLELSEPDTAAGKIPTMKRMRHAHDKIFGGPDVGNRFGSDDDVNDTRMDEDASPASPPSPPPAPRKKPRLPEPQYISDEEFNMDEPRTVRSYADLLM